VPISGHVGRLGSIQHREFAMASGEMSQAEFHSYCSRLFGHLANFRPMARFISSAWTGAISRTCWSAGLPINTDLKTISASGTKTNGRMGSLYR